MLRWLLAFAVILVLGVGTASAQDTPQKPTKKSHKTVEEIFKAKDTNKDGKLSKEEYLAGVPETKKAKREKAFTAMDSDKDGFVTPEEMKAAFAKMKEHHKKGGK
jgi:Ca2+-binding EF-hand superfamily protein